MMLGLFRDHEGLLRQMATPYRGAKILAGASAGEVLFYDPKKRLEEAQFQSGRLNPIDEKKWDEIMKRMMVLEEIFHLGIPRVNHHLGLIIDGEQAEMTPEDFKWIVPKGELEGYH